MLHQAPAQPIDPPSRRSRSTFQALAYLSRARQASSLAQAWQAPALKQQLCWHLVQVSLQLRAGGEVGCAPPQPSPQRRARVGA